jgi:hypothetical protein
MLRQGGTEERAEATAPLGQGEDEGFNQLSNMIWGYAPMDWRMVHFIVDPLISHESPDVRLRLAAICLELLPHADPRSEYRGFLIGVLQGTLGLFESSRDLVTQFDFLMGVLDCQMGMQVIPVPEYRVYATPDFTGDFLEHVLINKLLDSYPEIGKAMSFTSRLWICLNKFGVFKSDYERFNGLYCKSVDVLLDIFQRLRKDANALGALINCAKVHGHGHKEKQIACMEVALRALGGRDFSVLSFLSVAQRGKMGLDALFTCARIPGDPERQFACAEAAIRFLGGIGIDIDNVFTPDILLHLARSRKEGLDAILTYARIPCEEIKRFACVEAAIRFLGGIGMGVDNVFTPDILLRVAGSRKEGLDAILTCARIPSDPERQFAYAEAAIRFLGGIGIDIDNVFTPDILLHVAGSGKEGLDAILTYARIPGNHLERQLACAEAAIRFFGGIGIDVGNVFTPDILLHVAGSRKKGLDAILTCARIPSDLERQLVCAEACAIARYGEGFHWGQIADDEILRGIFLNIIGLHFFNSIFEGKRFQNGELISDFYYPLRGIEPPKASEDPETPEASK